MIYKIVVLDEYGEEVGYTYYDCNSRRPQLEFEYMCEELSIILPDGVIETRETLNL